MGNHKLGTVAWPASLTSLRGELASHPGRLALLRQVVDTDSAVKLMSKAIHEEPRSSGRALTAGKDLSW